MSQIVVDTDVASYIFNWHSLAQHNAEALRGRGIAHGAPTTTSARCGRGFAPMRGRQAGR